MAGITQNKQKNLIVKAIPLVRIADAEESILNKRRVVENKKY